MPQFPHRPLPPTNSPPPQISRREDPCTVKVWAAMRILQLPLQCIIASVNHVFLCYTISFNSCPLLHPTTTASQSLARLLCSFFPLFSTRIFSFPFLLISPWNPPKVERSLCRDLSRTMQTPFGRMEQPLQGVARPLPSFTDHRKPKTPDNFYQITSAGIESGTGLAASPT